METTSCRECKALLVGVDEYDNAMRLDATVSDVEAFRKALQDYCFISDKHIEVVSGRVERVQFDESFLDFCRIEAKIGIVYFSCHGQKSGDGMTVAFSDGRSESMRYVIHEAAKTVDSLWVVVDACHSGGVKLHPDPHAG